MPHLSVEYSANLDDQTDVGALCDKLRAAVLETCLFEPGAVRVRAIRCDHYAVADLDPENTFADLNFRLGRGRSREDRRCVGEAIFAAACEALAPLFESPHFALSLEVREIDPELSWKRNTIHDRLRNPESRGERNVHT